jgi:AAA ATPase domain
VLGAHRRLLRAAFAQFDGREVGTEGDSFFVVFARASDAVAAAAHGQRALAGHSWPDGVELRVRMGMHTGEPIGDRGGYTGLVVHRAARICAAGHGGQVLLSQATRELLGAELPAGVGLRELGEHRLRDLTHPQRLSQLVIAGLPDVFPALHTLGSRPANLPMQMTRFVGRERELARLQELLDDPARRLVTLVGPGGIGKTRLAVEAASARQDRARDAVVFVSLAGTAPARPEEAADLVVGNLATALGVSLAVPRDPLELLCDHLAARELLLVLDNLEQLQDAAKVVATLLVRAAGVKVLATSRRRLGLEGECLVEVAGLPYPPPDPNVDARSCEAVQLFEDHARLVRPGLRPAADEDVGRICRLVAGVPLAIELAARWVRTVTPAVIADRLAGDLDLLATSAPDVERRHRSRRQLPGRDRRMAADAPGQVLAALGVRRDLLTRAFRPPGEATVRRVLARIEAEALDRTIGAWLASQQPPPANPPPPPTPRPWRQGVAVDGKTLRGSGHHQARRSTCSPRWTKPAVRSWPRPTWTPPATRSPSSSPCWRA